MSAIASPGVGGGCTPLLSTSHAVMNDTASSKEVWDACREIYEKLTLSKP